MQLMIDFYSRKVSASGIFTTLDFALEASFIAQVFWNLDFSPFHDVKLPTICSSKVA